MTYFTWTPGGGKVGFLGLGFLGLTQPKGVRHRVRQPSWMNLAKILETHLLDSNKVRPAY